MRQKIGVPEENGLLQQLTKWRLRYAMKLYHSRPLQYANIKTMCHLSTHLKVLEILESIADQMHTYWSSSTESHFAYHGCLNCRENIVEMACGVTD